MESVAEEGQASKPTQQNGRGSFVKIPNKELGKVLDYKRRKNADGKVVIYGHASASAVHALAIKRATPGQTLNEENVKKRFGMGWRRFNEALHVLKDCDVLERFQEGRRTFATEHIIGNGDGGGYVPLDKALIKERSTLVAFVAVVNLSPNPELPEDVASRFGITSPTTIRALVRDARAGGHIACNEDAITRKIQVARRDYDFGDTLSGRPVAKNGATKNGATKNGVHNKMRDEQRDGRLQRDERRTRFKQESTRARVSPEANVDLHKPPADAELHPSATPTDAHPSSFSKAVKAVAAAPPRPDELNGNPWRSKNLLGWIEDSPTLATFFSITEVSDELVDEVEAAFPDDTALAELVRGAGARRVHRLLLTAGGMTAVHHMAAAVMTHARKADPSGDVSDGDVDSPATARGAVGVVLQAIRDRIGRKPKAWLNSYLLIGERLAGQMHTSGITDRGTRVYQVPPTEEELASDGGGALQAVISAGGWMVLAPELQDGPNATKELLAFLSEEAARQGCLRTDVLAAVNRVLRSFIADGWNIDGRSKEKARSWAVFSNTVAARIEQRRKAC